MFLGHRITPFKMNTTSGQSETFSASKGFSSGYNVNFRDYNILWNTLVKNILHFKKAKQCNIYVDVENVLLKRRFKSSSFFNHFAGQGQKFSNVKLYDMAETF